MDNDQFLFAFISTNCPCANDEEDFIRQYLGLDPNVELTNNVKDKFINQYIKKDERMNELWNTMISAQIQAPPQQYYQPSLMPPTPLPVISQYYQPPPPPTTATTQYYQPSPYQQQMTTMNSLPPPVPMPQTTEEELLYSRQPHLYAQPQTELAASFNKLSLDNNDKLINKINKILDRKKKEIQDLIIPDALKLDVKREIKFTENFYTQYVN
jgi:hypothetical protein